MSQIQLFKDNVVYWAALALLLLSLTVATLGLTFAGSNAPAFMETSGLYAEPDAVLACQGPGGGSNGGSGYC